MTHRPSNPRDSENGNAQRFEFVLFLLITFGFSWILWIPLLIPSVIHLMPLGGEPLSDAPSLLVLPIVFVYATLIGGGQEEIGWRGIAQALVEGRYGVFIGGAVVGLFWVLWHLPLFLSSTLPFESINPIVFGPSP